MFNKKKWSLLFSLVLLSMSGFAQSAQEAAGVNNEGWMRSEGKVYVAMTIAVTILAGLILFVVRLDRKIYRLEKGK